MANRRFWISLACSLISMYLNVSARAIDLASIPPYLAGSQGVPMTMINLSKDVQLSYKAYNEYTVLDRPGVPETTYRHTYTYYGYFDPHKCYVYDTSARQYNPNANTDDKYCNAGHAGSQWSGNFLNWASMTRMDVVRKILYGGYRKVDTATETVLERAYLPTDAHSFAKWYQGDDIGKLTPFDGSGEITLCNTTITSSTSNANRYSQTNTDPPLIRVAAGNYSLWNSNERWQCYWREEKDARNGNDPAKSGLDAEYRNPSKAANGLGEKDYVVRVRVCSDSDDDLTDDERSRCRKYPSGDRKPIGLLHVYGETDRTEFGLITGSFAKNISGGVLRRNVMSFGSEVNKGTDGTFTNAQGIVYNLNRLRIYGYDYADGTYIGQDNCSFQRIGIGTGGPFSVNEGECSSWGNPIGTMFLEALRYFAGKSGPTPAFATSGGKDSALGLTTENWQDPFKRDDAGGLGDPSCRPINIVNFNASVSSYDYDASKWSGFSGLKDAPSINDLTDAVGTSEGLGTSSWLVGNSDAAADNLCTAKSISRLSQVRGVCPEAPTYYGSYKIAGAALYAHTHALRDDIPNTGGSASAFKVNTYSVALSTAAPRIELDVKGKKVTIQPSYRLNMSSGGNVYVGGGTLVDFRVVQQTATDGRYVVQWEDSEQGGDYDQDVWGILSYHVDGEHVDVTTDVIDASTSNPQGFGYVITGTNKDGVHYHSGILGFSYDDAQAPTHMSPSGVSFLNASGGCNNCQVGDAATTATYTAVDLGHPIKPLNDPLYFAAKYGNFTGSYVAGQALQQSQWDSKGTSGAPGADGLPDAYFYAVEPAQLEESIRAIFESAIKSGGAAPAFNSSSLSTGTKVFLSKFYADTTDYARGEVYAYSLDAQANLVSPYLWEAGTVFSSQPHNYYKNGREVITNKGATGIPFEWNDLDASQQSTLRQSGSGFVSKNTAKSRLDYLRGDRSQEGKTGFRTRKSILGDIINSNTWYVGAPSAQYTQLDHDGGYPAFADAHADRTSMVYVGANDGMLHAFDADTGEEAFAYVPSAVFPGLYKLTDPAYVMQPYVDGPVFTGDAKAATGVWTSYLIGSLGRGGQGIFALDVTDPSHFNESHAADLFKWEFTDRDDSDLGNVIGPTTLTVQTRQSRQIVQMRNGRWALLLGNGYASDKSDDHIGTGRAALYILFLDGPGGAGGNWRPTTSTFVGDYVKIPVAPDDCGGTRPLTDIECVGAGPDNGMGVPTPIDVDGDGRIDYIYAADLKGNVWKFNVKGDPSTWATTYSRLYSAKAPDGTAQSITTAVSLIPQPLGGIMVNFVTGRALGQNDLPSTQVQTLYGIWDRPVHPATWPPSGRTTLQEQRIGSVVSGDGKARTGNSVDVDFNIKDGWYFDLPFAGETGIFNPGLTDSDVLVTDTIFPKSAAASCTPQSSIITTAVDPITGKIPEMTFDLNRDGVFNDNDLVTDGGNSMAASGVVSEGAVTSSTGLRQGSEQKFLTFTPDGDPNPNPLYIGSGKGRIYWREVPRNLLRETE
ncbi:MAG: pilus assembly protein [Burkholderiaceae bacterium]